MLSANDGRISEKLLSTAVERADVITDFDELDVSLFESYPVLVQPNLVHIFHYYLELLKLAYQLKIY